MIDERIISLYISLSKLTALERGEGGHSDSSEWPFSFYEQIMEASDEFEEALNAASEKFEEEEIMKQLSCLERNKAKC